MNIRRSAAVLALLALAAPGAARAAAPGAAPRTVVPHVVVSFSNRRSPQRHPDRCSATLRFATSLVAGREPHVLFANAPGAPIPLTYSWTFVTYQHSASMQVNFLNYHFTTTPVSVMAIAGKPLAIATTHTMPGPAVAGSATLVVTAGGVKFKDVFPSFTVPCTTDGSV